MSGTETLQSKNRSVKSTEIPDNHDSYLMAHHDIIYHYKNYILYIYGVEAWDSLINEDYFNTLFYEKVYKYGIAVFQDMVNLTANRLDISISDIITSFGEYYRKHS